MRDESTNQSGSISQSIENGPLSSRKMKYLPLDVWRIVRVRIEQLVVIGAEGLFLRSFLGPLDPLALRARGPVAREHYWKSDLEREPDAQHFESRRVIRRLNHFQSGQTF